MPATGMPGRRRLQKIVDDLGTEFDVRGDGDVEQLIGAAQEAPVVRLVNQLLTDALRLHASDIHIEPGRDRCACATASMAACARSAPRRPGWRRP